MPGTYAETTYVWPAYVVNLRARIKCPVCLLVIAANEAVARWAALPIEPGGNQRFTPHLLGPAAVPRITDPAAAREDPELAVFSVMAHGRDEPHASVQIALAAIAGCADLDAERITLYVDLVRSSISEAARRALQITKPANYAVIRVPDAAGRPAALPGDFGRFRQHRAVQSRHDRPVFSPVFRRPRAVEIIVQRYQCRKSVSSSTTSRPMLIWPGHNCRNSQVVTASP